MPLQRTGTSDEIARAVAFLADNTEAGWITGHLLTIDGGYTLTNGSAMTFDALQMAFQKGAAVNGTNSEHIEDTK
jgi:enoyl-[acyl-carrier-protein] reductase (NADH)